MRYTILALITGGALLTSAAIHSPARLAVKTSVLEKTPRTITYYDLASLAGPLDVTRNDRRYETERIPLNPNHAGLAEGDIIQVLAWLHLAALEADGDYHLQISGVPSSMKSCVIVEIPNARIVPDLSLAAKASLARSEVRELLPHRKEPSASGTLIRPAVRAEITGQLFFDTAHVGDKPRGKKGCQAATLWEIHPVTAFRAL